MVLLAFVIKLVRLESGTTPQGMLVCFCGYSYPTLHCNISILRLSIVFYTKFQKIFFVHISQHIRLLPCGLFLCPDKIKVYILKSRCLQEPIKKDSVFLPNPHISIIHLLVGSNGTYHVVLC